MGKRGPRPTPTAILRLRGSRRAELRGEEIEPNMTEPVCPDWLDEPAKACWGQLIPDLQEMGVLAHIDGNALARYCAIWVHWVAAQKFIQQNGPTYVAREIDGVTRLVKPWPQVAQMSCWNEQLRRLESEFGMSPAARAGVPAALQKNSCQAAI
jgi:P27 family predicted phage terminase small subunit